MGTQHAPRAAIAGIEPVNKITINSSDLHRLRATNGRAGIANFRHQHLDIAAVDLAMRWHAMLFATNAVFQRWLGDLHAIRLLIKPLLPGDREHYWAPPMSMFSSSASLSA